MIRFFCYDSLKKQLDIYNRIWGVNMHIYENSKKDNKKNIGINYKRNWNMPLQFNTRSIRFTFYIDKTVNDTTTQLLAYSSELESCIASSFGHRVVLTTDADGRTRRASFTLPGAGIPTRANMMGWVRAGGNSLENSLNNNTNGEVYEVHINFL